MLESTLSGRKLIKSINTLHGRKYNVLILFLFLDSIELCHARIEDRVQKGGHDVPYRDIKRRYERSFRNFWKDYRFLADMYHIIYNGQDKPIEVMSCYGDETEIHNHGLYVEFSRLVKRFE